MVISVNKESVMFNTDKPKKFIRKGSMMNLIKVPIIFDPNKT